MVQIELQREQKGLDDNPEPSSSFKLEQTIEELLLDQPASNETIRAIIEEVKFLTPPPMEGEREAFVFQREAKIGKFVLRQLGMIDISNSKAVKYHKKNKDQFTEPINVEVYKNNSLVEFIAVNGTEQDGYAMTKSTFTDVDLGDMVDFIETVTIMNEKDARALLVELQSLRSKKQPT